jgi:hypothetical protein
VLENGHAVMSHLRQCCIASLHETCTASRMVQRPISLSAESLFSALKCLHTLITLNVAIKLMHEGHSACLHYITVNNKDRDI